MAVHQATDVPQFLSTDRHILQGYLDMAKYPVWNPATKGLAGTSKVVGGETYRVIIAANGHTIKQCQASTATCGIKLIDKENNIYELDITNDVSTDLDWKVAFVK